MQIRQVNRTIRAGKTEEKAEDFSFGNISSPYGATGRYFTYGGRPILPVTGEFHFSRCRREMWERELAKMKGQGLDGVAVYVFWNHHEVKKDVYDFSGNKDIRAFITLCKRAGLAVVLRIGPWCHGEVRYGGFPDYVALMPGIRSNNARYLARVEKYWKELYKQVREFCDGKTVIGIQLENEYTGNIGHIVRLRELAEEVGFKTPFFTMTAWPTNTPDKRFLPMFGGYPEAPWTQNKRPLAPAGRFAISPMRGETEIGEDIIKTKNKKADFTAFPYATCETGTGNQVTNHRRPVISDKDGYGVAFAHFASGVNWLGYYMYHGGRNPSDRPMQESRRTFYPNNYPVIDYDFQAPVSKDGDIREHGDRLRLLHYFIKSDEEFLAQSGVYFAEEREKPFVSVRTDGARGYVFYSNYERGEKTYASAVQTVIKNDGGAAVELPAITVKSGDMFFHPFNCVYGGEKFDYIAAQSITSTTKDGVKTYWFAKTGETFVVRGGKREDVGDILETDGQTRLAFLDREQALRFYSTSKGAVFSGCAVFEKDGKVYAELKEDEKAVCAGVETVCTLPAAPPVRLEKARCRRLKYNSYMFSTGRRAYYSLNIPAELLKDCDDAEITLSFGGLNLQIFSGKDIVDDYFNTDGNCVFRLSGIGGSGEFTVRVCAPASFGAGCVYNEINLKPGCTELSLKAVKRIKVYEI